MIVTKMILIACSTSSYAPLLHCMIVMREQTEICSLLSDYFRSSQCLLVFFNFLSCAAPQNQRSFFTAFTKKANATADGTNTSESGAGEEGDTGEEVEAAVDVHFEPVIPLPELVPVYTGEENDELLYAQRAKLYVYHPDTAEWKERALGEAKILRCSDGRARIVVRRDMVSK